MAGLLFFAFKICAAAVLICGLISAIIAKFWVWLRPTIERQKVAFFSACILPCSVALIALVAFALVAFDPDPVSGPQVQGGLIIVMVVLGLVVLGIPVGYASARIALALSKPK
jgi:hypothetical protein